MSKLILFILSLRATYMLGYMYPTNKYNITKTERESVTIVRMISTIIYEGIENL